MAIIYSKSTMLQSVCWKIVSLESMGNWVWFDLCTQMILIYQWAEFSTPVAKVLNSRSGSGQRIHRREQD